MAKCVTSIRYSEIGENTLHALRINVEVVNVFVLEFESHLSLYVCAHYHTQFSRNFQFSDCFTCSSLICVPCFPSHGKWPSRADCPRSNEIPNQRSHSNHFIKWQFFEFLVQFRSDFLSFSIFVLDSIWHQSFPWLNSSVDMILIIILNNCCSQLLNMVDSEEHCRLFVVLSRLSPDRCRPLSV